jgi:hypothetical protein
MGHVNYGKEQRTISVMRTASRKSQGGEPIATHPLNEVPGPGRDGDNLSALSEHTNISRHPLVFKANSQARSRGLG